MRKKKTIKGVVMFPISHFSKLTGRLPITFRPDRVFHIGRHLTQRILAITYIQTDEQ